MRLASDENRHDRAHAETPRHCSMLLRLLGSGVRALSASTRQWRLEMPFVTFTVRRGLSATEKSRLSEAMLEAQVAALKRLVQFSRKPLSCAGAIAASKTD